MLLVILILLQSGKEGMGVIFGGGNSSVFGSTGAGGILAKLTTLMAIIFVITSLSYTYVTSTHKETESKIINVQIEETAPAPPVQSAPTEQTLPPASNAPVKPETPAPPVTAPEQGTDAGSAPAATQSPQSTTPSAPEPAKAQDAQQAPPQENSPAPAEQSPPPPKAQ